VSPTSVRSPAAVGRRREPAYTAVVEGASAVTSELEPVGLTPHGAAVQGLARGVVVEAPCHKPEGRGFDSQSGHCLILPASPRPWGLLSL
jgi:hypothetical protein